MAFLDNALLLSDAAGPPSLQGIAVMNPVAWAAVILAGLVAGLTPLMLRPMLHRMGVIDEPNHRSSHSSPTLRGAGIAQLLAVLCGGSLAGLGMMTAERQWIPMIVVVLAAGCTGVVGLAEDIRGLRQSTRAGLQLLVGGILAFTLGLTFGSAWWWVPSAALLFAAYVNFTNFMDGINGISSIYGFVAGIAYAAFGWTAEEPWLTTIGLVIGVSFLVFLPWNITAPGMFLGDVGSYLLGAGIVGTAIASMFVGLSPIVAISPLAIYLADAMSTLLRRSMRGEPIFEAHRSHVYQRLTKTGLSHLQSSGIVGGFTVATSAIGIGLLGGALSWGIALGALLLVCGTYVLLPGWLGDAGGKVLENSVQPVRLPLETPLRPDWAPLRWAIIGGSGFIGNALANKLESMGIHVVRVKAPRVQLAPTATDGQEVSVKAATLSETETLATELQGFEVVVNAAGAASPDSGATQELYGANSLLPGVVGWASRRAGVQRVIHLSSVAVQGDRPVLDESPDAAPFSPYSRSKALGERTFFAAHADGVVTDIDFIVIRATSVQGKGRQTTRSLQRVARSRLASVAAPGNQPSVVSSLEGLLTFVHHVGSSKDPQGPIRLQPWEGLSVIDVLQIAGGKPPAILPAWFCRSALSLGRIPASLIPRFSGLIRRVEVMWFGQAQEIAADSRASTSWLSDTLSGGTNE